MSVPLLELTGVHAGYGRIPIIADVGFSIATGEVVGLLGRNGMGKTTTVRAIAGLLPVGSGEIRFQGERIDGRVPEEIARLGLGLVPEGRQIFPNLTVRENLLAFAGNRLGRPDPWTLDRVLALFPQLKPRLAQGGGRLSGGEQQMLAVGRALMTNPALVIFDEATEGLAPLIRAEIWACIRLLKAAGQSIILIDKNIEILAGLADRQVILERGRVAWTGGSDALLADRTLWHRYLGV